MGSFQKYMNIRFLKWDKLNNEKDIGGLGIRSLQELNRARIGKIIWNFMENPNKLWRQLMRAKYTIDSSFWSCENFTRCSFTWTVMINCRDDMIRGWVAAGLLVMMSY